MFGFRVTVTVVVFFHHDVLTIRKHTVQHIEQIYTQNEIDTITEHLLVQALRVTMRQVLNYVLSSTVHTVYRLQSFDTIYTHRELTHTTQIERRACFVTDAALIVVSNERFPVFFSFLRNVVFFDERCYLFHEILHYQFTYIRGS